MKKELIFPDNFLWGSAVSSYQVEGGVDNCDWSKDFPAGRACDYYNLYEKYFDIAKDLGHNIHRLSLEWSRIEPEEGVFSSEVIEHYKNMLIALRKRGIKTMVTLWHFTTPEWLSEKGGWTNKKSVDFFERYSQKVSKELDEYVDYWVTINEPMIYASQAYIIGRFPPKKKDLYKTAKVVLNLTRGHIKAYDIIKKSFPEAKIAFAENYSFPESANKNIFAKKIIKLWDFLRNKMLLKFTIDKQDFIGVNYYFHEKVEFRLKYPFVFMSNANKQVSDIGTEIYPKGIYMVLKRLKKYNKPIYITENGLADQADRKREKFIKNHLEWIHKAIEQGVDVRGYLHWSLLDNFEWADGFEPRFGLVEINFSTLEYNIRPSAFVYAEICKNNKLITE